MDESEAHAATQTKLTITGMVCSGCAATVQRVLSRLPGVSRAHVDFDTAGAVVDGSASPEQLVTAVEAAGYGANLSDAA